MEPPRQANGREMTRAERFEDEKQRIVESCFNKKDTDGSCEYGQRSGVFPDSRICTSLALS
jgi:hypothetical protein